MPASTRQKRGKTRQTKDRVLQARIPSQLDDELREHAEQLGISVSTVVRNVLLNTFQLVEGVVADSSNIARALQGRRPRPHRLASPTATDDEHDTGVIGWQEAVLNLNGICDQCNTILPRGTRAAVGVPAQPRPVVLCLSCLEALAGGDCDESDTAD
ncbi:MAG: hypothetical protein V2I26_09665 [Halieaceae bacterium]|jgi:hypothetical protein|nr:hypothetical protein [Halieaceae bacterium]